MYNERYGHATDRQSKGGGTMEKAHLEGVCRASVASHVASVLEHTLGCSVEVQPFKAFEGYTCEYVQAHEFIVPEEHFWNAILAMDLAGIESLPGH